MATWPQPRFYIERTRHGGWMRFTAEGPKWRDVQGSSKGPGVRGHGGRFWNIAASFGSAEDAVDACRGLRRDRPGIVKLRVTDENHKVVWSEFFGWTSEYIKDISPVLAEMMTLKMMTLNPQEEQMATDLNQPLHIKRTTLIDTLTTNLEAERARRQEAQEAVTKRRQEAQDAVASLDADEMLNLVQKYVDQSLDAIVEMVKDAKESGRLKSVDQKPNDKETSLEKTVRILGLASDDEIEVKPTDPIYPLL